MLSKLQFEAVRIQHAKEWRHKILLMYVCMLSLQYHEKHINQWILHSKRHMCLH